MLWTGTPKLNAKILREFHGQFADTLFCHSQTVPHLFITHVVEDRGIEQHGEGGKSSDGGRRRTDSPAVFAHPDKIHNLGQATGHNCEGFIPQMGFVIR